MLLRGERPEKPCSDGIQVCLSVPPVKLWKPFRFCPSVPLTFVALWFLKSWIFFWRAWEQSSIFLCASDTNAYGLHRRGVLEKSQPALLHLTWLSSAGISVFPAEVKPRQVWVNTEFSGTVHTVPFLLGNKTHMKLFNTRGCLHTCIRRSKCTKICHKMSRFHSAQNSSLALLWVLSKGFLAFLTQFFPDCSPTHTPPSPACMAVPMTSFLPTQFSQVFRQDAWGPYHLKMLSSLISVADIYFSASHFVSFSITTIFLIALAAQLRAWVSQTHSELLIFSKKEDVIFDIYKLPGKCLHQTESKMSM